MSGISSDKAVVLLSGTVPGEYTKTRRSWWKLGSCISSVGLQVSPSQQGREVSPGRGMHLGKHQFQARHPPPSPFARSPLAADIQHSSELGNAFILLKREGHFSALKKIPLPA